MKLSPQEAIYFLEPVTDVVSSLLVATDEVVLYEYGSYRSTNSGVGSVIKITRTATEARRGRLWYVDADGAFVDGAPLLTRPLMNKRSAQYIAPLGDGLFVMGTPRDRDGFVFDAPRYSNQSAPAEFFSLKAVTSAALAATWADELFPTPTDSDAVVRAKVDLAREMWQQRTKRAALYRESIERDWTEIMIDFLKTRDEDIPRFSAMAIGTALISVGSADPIPAASDAATILASARNIREGYLAPTIRTYAEVNFSTPVNLTDDNTVPDSRELRALVHEATNLRIASLLEINTSDWFVRAF